MAALNEYDRALIAKEAEEKIDAVPETAEVQETTAVGLRDVMGADFTIGDVRIKFEDILNNSNLTAEAVAGVLNNGKVVEADLLVLINLLIKQV